MPRWLGVPIVVVALTTPAAGQSAATSFEDLRARLEAGQRVVLTEEGRARTTGTVIALSDSALDLLVDGVERRYTEDHVSAIRRTDSRLNGFLIGMGGVVGLMLPYCLAQEFEAETFCLAFLTPVLGALGGLVGYGIDGLNGSNEVFRRPASRSFNRRAPVHPGPSPFGAGVTFRLAF